MPVYNDDGTVTITQEEYQVLLDESLMLRCIYGAGVDCWEGIDDAIESFNEAKEIIKK